MENFRKKQGLLEQYIFQKSYASDFLVYFISLNMFLKRKSTKTKIIFAVLLICLGALFFRAYFLKEKRVFGTVGQKKIAFFESGLAFETFSKAETVADFLKEQKVELAVYDVVYPTAQVKIFSGTIITAQRAKKILIKENGKSQEVYSLQDTVEQALWENKNISLGDDDLTVPSRQTLLKNEIVIKVTHVLIKEEIKNQPIAFTTKANEDDSLGWRIKKVTQKGQNGNTEVKYKVVYYDGKEISRKILEKKVTQEPTEEVVTQGTLVKIGKVHTGVASWYAYTGTLAAANPWLPMGSYVRVTNKENGKSVIVKINDRGPFGNGRIIDLDKVAFEKIASLGQGTAEIKMEVILN